MLLDWIPACAGMTILEIYDSQRRMILRDAFLKMKIWVDADACPVVIKEILYRSAMRTGVSTTLVANAFLRVPPSANIFSIQVEKGFDVADNYIVQAVEVGDLVITADIPLAAQVVAKGAHALNPRGEMYTSANIAERLAMRDMMDELRSQGAEIGGPAAFNQANRQKFAAELDRFIARHINKTASKT